VSYAARADLDNSAGRVESDAAELGRLTQELAAIGCRVGQLGHTSETLVLLARTLVLIAGSLSSIGERVNRLERNVMPPATA
jgi:hypothetical protein